MQAALALLSPRDMDRLLARLPAEQRAALAWAPNAIRQALRLLQRGNLSADVIREATKEVLATIFKLLPKLTAAFSDDAWKREADSLVKSKRELLRSFITDETARDAAEWVLEAMRGVLNTVVTSVGDELQQHLADEKKLESVVAATQDMGFVNAMVLLMALIDAAEEKRHPEHAAELAETAFLEASNDVGVLANAGLHAATFLDETPEDRVSRLLRYAEHARNELGDSDADVLSQGRLRNLR